MKKPILYLLIVAFFTTILFSNFFLLYQKKSIPQQNYLSSNQLKIKELANNQVFYLSCQWLGTEMVLSVMKDNSVRMFRKGNFKGQKWRSIILAQNVLQLSPLSNPNFVLTLNTKNNSLFVANNRNAKTQQWAIISYQGTDYGRIVSMADAYKSIDIFNDGQRNDTPYITQTANVSGQYWMATPAENGSNNNSNNNQNNNNQNQSSGTNGNPIAEGFLREHNRIRAERGLEPLTWSNEIAEYARQWANNLASNCNLVHRQNNRYGENLAMGGGMGNNPATFVRMWEDERQAFDRHFTQGGGTCCGGNFGSYGHFSQIVWRKTTQVGCAIVRCSNGGYVAVCNYNPPGNMQGGKPY